MCTKKNMSNYLFQLLKKSNLNREKYNIKGVE